MPHPPGKKAESRARILDAAIALFRTRGFENVTIDEVMGEAGLTRGGFYAHFANKDDLVAHALLPRPAEDGERESGAEALRAFAATYLSSEHRDHPEQGCTVGALTADVVREAADVRAAYFEFYRYFAGTIDQLIGNDAHELSDDALAIVAQMVGTLMTARAVPDSMLSVRILKAGRQAVEYLMPPELHDRE